MSSRPKNKNEYREELAEAFAHILEEKGLDWKKEWRGSGGGAPLNAITKAGYKGCNMFWLSLVSMMKGYNDPRWVTMVQIMDSLIRAIKDAQAAANYMDMKAGLISELEYENVCVGMMELRMEKKVMMER